MRHGETDWNRERRFQGHADTPLNDSGRAQARELAEQLAVEDIDAVYTSDLLRARETAEIIAARLGADVVALRELREIDVGEWQGLSWPEIEVQYPEGARRWHLSGTGWESGETYEQLGERIVPVLARIAETHSGGRVLVVVLCKRFVRLCGEFFGCAVVVLSFHAPAWYHVGRWLCTKPASSFTGLCIAPLKVSSAMRRHPGGRSPAPPLIHPLGYQRPVGSCQAA